MHVACNASAAPYATSIRLKISKNYKSTCEGGRTRTTLLPLTPQVEHMPCFGKV